MTRTFDLKPATRTAVPLLLGITGMSSSGKTMSAMRLATGIQRVVGGEIAVIDTEHRRALLYADKFKFQHLDFEAPFGPLDYLAAIEQCVASGARTLVIDSMTHEHNGEGGVMDQSAEYLDRKCGDDDKKRERNLMLSLVKPKQQRRKLNTRILQLGVNAIFCYRAADKIKPVPGQQPEKLGWMPETTSPLIYDMTARFLLEPGADGHITIMPEEKASKALVKLPSFFRGLVGDKVQLSEEIGQHLAEWARGPQARLLPADPAPVLQAIAESATEAELDSVLADARQNSWTREQKLAFKEATDARKAAGWEAQVVDPEDFPRD